MRVLIVDDEPIHRRGLANMIARLRPSYEIMDARNGLEALEYLMDNPVELLITDIQMPVMNGLQLIETLSGMSKNTKIIILSVYGHFDYAQQALKLGAFDYLLKPVDEEKVKLVFESVEKRILKEQEQQSEASFLKSRLEHMLPSIIEHKMNKLVYGALGSDEGVEIAELFPLDHCGVVIVFELDKQQGSMEQSRNDNINSSTNRSVKSTIDGILCEYGQSVSFFLQDETNSIVSVVETSCDFAERQHRLRPILNRIIEEVGTLYGVLVTVGVGNKFDKLFAEVSGSFKCAKKALNCKFYVGAGVVIFYNELSPKSGHASIAGEKKKELVDALLKLDVSLAHEIVEAVLQEQLLAGYPDVTEFTGTIVRLLENHIRIVEEKLNVSYMKKLKMDINPGLYVVGGLAELKEAIGQIINRLIGMMQEQKSNISGTIIDTCMRYIDDHYMEELSLEVVAQEFHFSAAYFSNIFKTHTNSNFSEYLNRTRMNHAKRLLRDTNLKVYEISKMVGYQDPKYFSRLFKKECGLTPEEYRRITGRNRVGISITESMEFKQSGEKA